MTRFTGFLLPILLFPQIAGATITLLNPSAVTAGRSAFVLNVTGVAFDETDEITWNGNILPRCGVAPCFTLLSATQITVQVPASFVAAPGIAQVGLRDFNNLPLTINARPAITTVSPLSNAVRSVAYSTRLVATGGSAPLRWAVTLGSLPPGLSLEPNSGVIGGTPTTAGVSSFTAVVTDASSVTDSRVFTLTVTETGLTITTGGVLPLCCVGVPFLQTLIAGGGVAPYVWSLVAGGLPPGIGLNGATGVLTGTPQTPGAFNFTLRVTDNAGATTTRDFLLTVAGPNPQERVIIAQIADGGPGGEWKTTFTVFNTSSLVGGAVRMRFFTTEGAPLVLDVIGEGRVNSLTRQIAPGGSAVIETSGADGTLAQGWVELVSCGAGASGPSITSYAIFRQRVAGRSDAEATVQSASSQGSELAFAFDNMGGFVTSFALVNPGAASATVRAIFQEENGTTIHEETFNLAASGHVAFATPIRFTPVTGKRGRALFTTSNGKLALLILRFSPSFSFTSVPHFSLAP